MDRMNDWWNDKLSDWMIQQRPDWLFSSGSSVWTRDISRDFSQAKKGTSRYSPIWKNIQHHKTVQTLLQVRLGRVSSLSLQALHFSRPCPTFLRFLGACYSTPKPALFVSQSVSKLGLLSVNETFRHHFPGSLMKNFLLPPLPIRKVAVFTAL